MESHSLFLKKMINKEEIDQCLHLELITVNVSKNIPTLSPEVCWKMQRGEEQF